MQDVMNPPGTFKSGQRLKELSLKDAPAMAGRLIPEFDRRGNIRDMFARKPSVHAKDPSANETSTPIQKGRTPERASWATKSDQPASSPIPGLSPSAGLAHAASPKNGGKRAAADASPSRPLKQSKSGGTSSSGSMGAGQQSLRGYFRSKSTASDMTTTPGADNKVPLPKRSSGTNALEDGGNAAILSTRPPSTNESEDVIDPIVSKESWLNLFSKPAAPRCEGHGEPCISLLTKKSGMNCGRSFWMCPR